MSQTVSIVTTVMLADICSSTYLFSQLGDENASQLVTQTLKQVAEIVRSHHGLVLRSKGDDVLCTFSNPQKALQAAIDIHAMPIRQELVAAEDLCLRIGINSGPALFSDGDILGDTVNIAARLCAFAKAGQTIISIRTLDLLDHAPPDILRPVGEMSFKGKPGPLAVFELLDASKQDEITQVGSVATHFPRSNRLSLRFQSQRLDLDYLLVRYLLGRSPDCNLVLDHPLVSRHHAEIRYQNYEFLLIDFSTNGTVLITNGHSRYLHHHQAALRGSGSIFLGRTVYKHECEIAFHASGGSRDFNRTHS
jgi:adenylate cyclase